MRARRKKVYLAAPFHMRNEIRYVREQLFLFGFEVISSWLDESRDNFSELSRGDKHRIANKCLFEVNKVSMVICFIDDSSKALRAGHQVEFGYALAKNKVLLSVGSAERNVFHEDLRVRQYPTIESFLDDARSWKNCLPQALSSAL